MKNLLFKTLRFIFGSSVFLAIWALHAFWVCKNQTLNSDLLYLESLYTDVISLQRPIGRFIFTEAMFLFPDFALYSLVRHFFAQPLEALVLLLIWFFLRPCTGPLERFTVEAHRFLFTCFCLSPLSC